MKAKFLTELKEYDTENISLTGQPTFLWDFEAKEIVTNEKESRKQYYTPKHVEIFQLSSTHNFDKWFKEREGRNIVFYLNGDSIFWEQNKLHAMID